MSWVNRMTFQKSIEITNEQNSAVNNGALVSSIAGQDARQKTLRGVAQCSGVGVHSGETMTLRLLPAEPNTGVVFFRTDLKNGARSIKASWDNVVDTQLCTVIGNDHGGHVKTIEHLMAAFRALEIDNVIVEVDGPEVPVMDGSAASFIFLIEMAGVVEQDATRAEIVILKPIEVKEGDKSVALLPSDEASFSVDIDFNGTLIGTQHYDFTLTSEGFKSEIARARTFGFYKDVELMAKHGRMLGGSLDNAVVIKDNAVMNEEGLRFDDEPVRHKLLDAIGDLSLAGAPIRGRFVGTKPGHDMNNKLLHALYAQPEAWTLAPSKSLSVAAPAK